MNCGHLCMFNIGQMGILEYYRPLSDTTHLALVHFETGTRDSPSDVTTDAQDLT